MKNRYFVHHHESARIYRHYYKPSVNFLRLLKAVLSVILTGSSPAGNAYYRR
ncbi:MAG: hypothetical protein IAE96_14260 [Chitinophagaceae bacterium]|nr:hypothetical protein [Chitinophagaceae bacterium]